MVGFADIYKKFMDWEIQVVSQDLNFKVYESGKLTQYKHYKIVKLDDTTDFTLVGAPSNTLGITFQANSSLVSPVWNGGALQTGKNIEDTILEYLESARRVLNAKAVAAGGSVDEEQQDQKEFLIYETMSLMLEVKGFYDKARTHHENAIKILYGLWGEAVFLGEVDMSIGGQSGSATKKTKSSVVAGISKVDWSAFDEAYGLNDPL